MVWVQSNKTQDMPRYFTVEERLTLARERGILVDEQDRWLLEEYTWHIADKGYVRTNLPRDERGVQANARLHNAILGCPIWEQEEIDHINRNPADNRRSNLRWTTPSGNTLNRRAWGALGERNIYLMGKKYQVQIKRKEAIHLIGGFDTLEEAIEARNAWLTDNP